MDVNQRLRLVTERPSFIAEGSQCPSCFTFNVPSLLAQSGGSIICPLCKHVYTPAEAVPKAA